MIKDPSIFENTIYIIKSLRYSHLVLRTSKLSLSEMISYLPFLLSGLDKSKDLIKTLKKFHDAVEEEGADFDLIKKEIENLGWYNIKLSTKPIIKDE
ncbi:hypothetical protein [Saccharolobus islandicus]|uniref:hypothetical protein n=1 Tax=Saccharolobus islandicus TaxID=43080 RepID=UPI00064FCD6C|nr:hypothetical protein [Sulfolobus islandicus]PVU76568.1 hypothetical protein DDW12_09835 [Sulfolobus islandicus]